MRLVFGLFDNYQDAKRAADELLEKGFDKSKLNAIVQEEAAKNALGTNLQSVGADKTDKVGEKTLHGLDALVAGQNPLAIPELGQVYAAGDEATLLAKPAMPEANTYGTFKEALIGLEVPDAQASAFVEGVANGGVLLFIRSDDEGAWEALETMRTRNAKEVSG